jgi:hypothetical protein
MLRRFLFLNHDLVGEFLAQVDLGAFEEESQRDVSRQDRKVGGEGRLSVAPASVSVSAGRGSASEAETNRVLRQTPESSFARLYEVTAATNDFQWLEAQDDEIWGDLGRGELIEVESVVTVSSLAKMGEIADSVGPLVEMMALVGENVDGETQEALAGLKGIGGLFGAKLPVIARAAGAQRFKFIAQLDREYVRVELDELEGEATLFAKIQRILRPSERYTVFDSMAGLGSLPRELRRSMQKDVKNEKELPDLVVSAPAAVVTPIAIYR